MKLTKLEVTQLGEIFETELEELEMTQDELHNMTMEEFLEELISEGLIELEIKNEMKLTFSEKTENLIIKTEYLGNYISGFNLNKYSIEEIKNENEQIEKMEIRINQIVEEMKNFKNCDKNKLRNEMFQLTEEINKFIETQL